ncbi:FAD-dependent oxidoreductase [Legionella sp. 227]|uniref:FAD-binding oxidoreductase n=1 Tax=Legionella sp. 227 TaxID=3367288 RepID=UPI00370D1F79
MDQNIPDSFFEQLQGTGTIIREPDLAFYKKNTLGINAEIDAVFQPECKEDVQKLVLLANKFQISLYPISTGRNWGLGSAIPKHNKSVVVDLSKMKQVIHFEEKTGIITIQPGVTQGDLRVFLDNKKAQFMSSITGAGPNTSIIGNILDKGVGVLGSAIHTIRSIECVLPDGSLYNDGINVLCKKQLTPPIRIGVGPLLEGLFIQCDFAIVTAMTIALYHQPKYITTFYISAPDKTALAKTIDIYHQYNALNGHSNILSGRWSKALLPTKQTGGYSYSCIIASMDLSLHQARKKMLKKLIRNAGLKGYSIGDKNILRLKKLFHHPFMQMHLSRIASLVDLLDMSLSYAKGYPNEHNLKEQYQLLQIDVPQDRYLELAEDGVGFIWYIVLFAATSENLLSFHELVSTSAELHQVTDNRFHVLPYKSDVLVGLARVAFNLSDPTGKDKAHAFYLDLLERGIKQGFVPHRVPIHVINTLVNLESPYWSLIKKIKDAIDPHHIIAPDKYWTK